MSTQKNIEQTTEQATPSQNKGTSKRGLSRRQFLGRSVATATEAPPTAAPPTAAPPRQFPSNLPLKKDLQESILVPAIYGNPLCSLLTKTEFWIYKCIWPLIRIKRAT